MQNLGLNNSTNKPKSGFFARQVQAQSSGKQEVFDWIFGVFMPVICFVFDPAVFKGHAFGSAILGNYKPFAYLLSFVSVMAMAAWLLWGTKLKWFNGFLAGLFFLGGAISLGIGIILIPFSLLGLIVLVGVLGFTPLLTAIVFLRSAFRAMTASKPFLDKGALVYAVAFGAIFSASVSWTINSEIKRSLKNIENGDAQIIYAEAGKLKYAAMLINFDALAGSYYKSKNGGQQTEKSMALAEIYKELTGENIDGKSPRLTD